MKVITKGAINRYIAIHPDSKAPLNKWFLTTVAADWRNLHDLKATFNSSDYIGNDLFVFNIGGNSYRLIARVFFRARLIYIRFIGTHDAYNKINTDSL